MAGRVLRCERATGPYRQARQAGTLHRGRGSLQISSLAYTTRLLTLLTLSARMSDKMLQGTAALYSLYQHLRLVRHSTAEEGRLDELA